MRTTDRLTRYLEMLGIRTNPGDSNALAVIRACDRELRVVRCRPTTITGSK